ncbi:acyltransferase family protein [Sphingomonas sp. SRS2]|uniref:acyltransferase family protein n=1 Tax=Sphingomonas sp. SRS2 TaxID=133190 RepID=UPI0006183F0C|nr:acyltransferase [Sphingomonas sp. SRS2]KKC26035.1 hypothetical protein WP12_10460 [Sphingomonas sp. SRS2]
MLGLKGAQATSQRASSPAAHQNNIGLLRLLLATGVVFGHACGQFGPGAPFGEPIRPLIPSSIDLATLCLDGFFMISGWLITMSMLRSSSMVEYLRHRIVRIYPGYLVAYAVSIWLIHSLYAVTAPAEWWRLTILQAPPSFRHGGTLMNANAALWTLAFEFRCYLAVGLLGMTGLLARRELIWKLTLGLLTLWLLCSYPPLSWRLNRVDYGQDWPLLYALIGDPSANLRLFTIFFIGVSGYLYRDVMERAIDHRIALLSAMWALLLLGHPAVAEWSICLVGSPLLYWLAFKAEAGAWGRINARIDISYGTYIYGWPIGLALALAGFNFWTYIAATIATSLVCGWLSWVLVEKPAKDVVRVCTKLGSIMARRRSRQCATACVRVDRPR